jgi:hypothetical protein
MRKYRLVSSRARSCLVCVNHVVAVLGLALICGLSACSTSGEDDASLEATDPVEASAEQETQDGAAEALLAPTSEPGEVESKVETTPEQATEAVVTETPQIEPQSSGPMINTSKRVLYVKVDTANMREQPDRKAKVVGKASRGEHFLVTIEGDWAKTEDGKYISMKVLSERGVGRVKKAADWGQGETNKPKQRRSSKSKRSPKPTPAAVEPSSSDDANSDASQQTPPVASPDAGQVPATEE